MDTNDTMRIMHVLLTGPPGIGKTTICKKIASILEKRGCRFDGFYTEEVRNETGSRIGFDVVTVKDITKRLSLARIKNLTQTQIDLKYQVGNYCVFPHNFEELASSVLDSDTDILFIDEIGKMELFSEDFKKKVVDIFFGSVKNVFVIGTIPQMHKVPQQHAALFQKLHADKRIKIFTVSRQNRNDLPEEILRHLPLI